MKTKPVIGFVGGIGSGKSYVARLFARDRGHLIVADALGHAALEQPEILARIRDRWKERVLNEQGQVDRKKMGAIVFASPVERANLEHLVFPWIEKSIRKAIEKAQADPAVSYIVLDAAILLEVGWSNVCDFIVYVSTPRATRLERLIKDRGWSSEEVALREHAQMPLTQKAIRADVAIDNSGTSEDLQRPIQRLLQQWHLI